MSDLTQLQELLAEQKEVLVSAKTLQDLKLTPAWQKIVEEGFIIGLAEKLVYKLADSTEEEKTQHLAVLTGISAFSRYLNEVTTKGELAVGNIQDIEHAIAELLGAQ